MMFGEKKWRNEKDQSSALKKCDLHEFMNESNYKYCLDIIFLQYSPHIFTLQNYPCLFHHCLKQLLSCFSSFSVPLNQQTTILPAVILFFRIQASS